MAHSCSPLLFCGLLLLLLFISPVAAQPIDGGDTQALGKLISALSGWPHQDWNASNVENACSWASSTAYYVTCDQEDPRRIIGITVSRDIDPSLPQLSGHALTGTLPEIIWKHPQIQYVWMDRNPSLGGNIPANASTTLRHMTYAETKIGGEIPELSGMNQLTHFHAGQTRHTGSLPVWVFQAPVIEEIILVQLELNGTLPVSMSPTITALDVSTNSLLTGVIPPVVGTLTNLGTFAAGVTGLTGEIPPGLYALPKIRHISVEHTAVTGSIPSEISTSLEYISLGSTNLTGSLPASLANCVNLTRLVVSSTNINGPIVTELFQLPKIAIIDILGTNISGVFPTKFSPTIAFLAIGSTQVTGELTPAICELQQLHLFVASRLNLTGELPHCLLNLPLLEQLDLAFNDLRGSLPETLGDKLALLYLSSNNLQGTIPVAFAQQSFTQLQLNSNKFYGTLPEKLFEIPTLEFLSLSNNAMIKGPLPEILSPSLKRLYLSYNAFYGTVPESWGSSNLRVVDVYSNQLRCPFPMSLMEKFKARVSAMRLGQNFFELVNGKICGQIPAPLNDTALMTGGNSFMPILGVMPPSMPQFSSSVVGGAIKVAVSEQFLYIFFRGTNGEFMEEEYIVWSFTTLEGYGPWAYFVGFHTDIIETAPNFHEAVGEFSNGMRVNFTFVGGAEGKNLKIGWTFWNPPHDYDPTVERASWGITQYLKAPIDERGYPLCLHENMFAVGVDFTELFYGNDVLLLDCPGSMTNFSLQLRLPAGEYIPQLIFKYTTRYVDTTLQWSLIGESDGQAGLLSLVQPAGFGNDGQWVRRGLPAEALAMQERTPMNQQYFGNVVRLTFPKFHTKHVYDPEILLNQVFALDEQAASLGWIAAVVIGALAVVAIGAAFLIPGIRSKVFPFLTRQDDDLAPVDATQAVSYRHVDDSPAPTRTDHSELTSKPSWKQIDKDSTALHNVLL